MSTETLAVVISAVGLLLGFVGAFAWMIRRTDEQYAALRSETTEQFTALRNDLGPRITAVERELVEVKIAVARIEGPPRHIIPAR